MPASRVIKPVKPKAKAKASKPIQKPIARASLIVHPELKDMGFASVPAVPLTELYSSGISGGVAVGSVNTKSEINIQVVDYYDYNGFSFDPGSGANILTPVSNYFWRLSQNLFDNNLTPSTAYDVTDTVCRVRKLEVFVMPRFQVGSAPNMFTVNTQVPAVTSSGDSGGSGPVTVFATNTQVTNVLPTANPKWKKVLSCNMDKTFQSGVYRPFFAFSSDPSTGNELYDQCLFQLSVTSPDDGTPYFPAPSGADSGPTLKFKVVMHCDQPIQPINDAILAVHQNATFGTPNANGGIGGNLPYPGTSSQYVQMGIKGMLNRMS